MWTLCCYIDFNRAIVSNEALKCYHTTKSDIVTAIIVVDNYTIRV